MKGKTLTERQRCKGTLGRCAGDGRVDLCEPAG